LVNTCAEAASHSQAALVTLLLVAGADPTLATGDADARTAGDLAQSPDIVRILFGAPSHCLTYPQPAV
jgi:hypothetical protein